MEWDTNKCTVNCTVILIGKISPSIFEDSQFRQVDYYSLPVIGSTTILGAGPIGKAFSL